MRYYGRNQLLTPSGRLASGYRRYGELELRRLQFIRRAKALELFDACPGHGRAADCPILKALSEVEPR